MAAPLYMSAHMGLSQPTTVHLVRGIEIIFPSSSYTDYVFNLYAQDERMKKG